MKKNLFLTLAICAIVGVTASAQQPTFWNKDNVVNIGVGLGGNLYSGSYYSGASRLPFISASFEHCLLDNLFDSKSSLGIGGILGYTQAKWDGDYWGYKSSNIIIGARGALHYALVDKLDTYAGFTLGYNIVSWKWTGTGHGDSGSAKSNVTYGFYAGARYYFTDAIGAFAEVGYGYTILTLGLSFKF